MIYGVPGAGNSLSQADILDGCPVFALEEKGQDIDLNAEPLKWQERVLVLTQACDLAQIKTTKVVVALVYPAQSLVERGVLKAPTIRDQLRRGLAYGWYFLPAAPAPIALPES